MIWAVLLLQCVLIWFLVDIRRALRLRALPSPRPKAVTAGGAREGFPGAVPPSRFVVVRWPDGHHFYSGCDGAKGRKMFEHTNPAPGEEVEFWELGDRRGHKVG